MVTGKIRLRGFAQDYETVIDRDAGTVRFNGERYGIDKLPFDVPISGTVYGTLLNFKGALAALEEAVYEAPYKKPPEAPILYIKPVNTHIGHGMAIPLPFDVQELHMGGALGVVIGRTATRVNREDALDYIAGYTIVNDVSVPHQSFYRPAIREKARDGFCPIGPWMIDRGAVENPNALGIRVFVNGELCQENTTANQIRSVEQLLADVTDFMTLNPGDVLMTGVPEDAPLARAGDRVRIEIDGVGALENSIVPEKNVFGVNSL
ncbi:MAG: fumarylacetoacetate hydrolase family protein [Tuberibacillus sp.]